MHDDEDHLTDPEFSPEMRKRFEDLLAEQGIEPLADNGIPLRTSPGPAPLSFAQQRLWFLHQLDPESPIYNIPVFMRISGDLDGQALSSALGEIVRRHESLRTAFPVVDGNPVQWISPPQSYRLQALDWTEVPRSRQSNELQQLASQQFRKPFDLVHDNLLRMLLVRLGTSEHVLLLSMHHIVSDAWSAGVFARELSLLYKAFAEGRRSPLPELPIQYADYAVWQREWLQGAALENQLRYWRQQLAGAPELLRLPTDRPRPPQLTYSGASEPFALDEQSVDSLRQVSRSCDATLFMTVLGAFQVLLARYSGQEDVAVGSPVAGRNRTEIEPLIGFFVNTVVLRTDLSGNPTVQELLQQVRKTALHAYANQDAPFEKLVEELQPERDLGRTPLFQVMMAMQNTPVQEWALPGVNLRVEDVENDTAKFDVSLFLHERGKGIYGSVRYRTDLFDASTIQRLVRHFRLLLETIARNSQQLVHEIPLLSAEERFQILVDWNQTERQYSKGRYIHHFFEDQVQRTPENTAVVHEGGELTYDEVNRRANQLAHYLRNLGVGPDVVVNVCLQRTPNMLVALLAVLKAGGAYVPTDPAYPPERLLYILDDARPKVILTESQVWKQLAREGPPCRVVCLDSDCELIAQESQDNTRVAVDERNLAYVMYTSGSTGKPKGVAIEHRSTTAFLHWAGEFLTDEDLRAVLASTSICFDISVMELFATLSRGGKLLIADNALHLPELRDCDQITLINTVPSAMRELISGDGLPPGVRVVMLAGEALDPALVAMVYAQPQVEQVFNLYGPTEDTIYSTWARMRKGDAKTPIGRSLANKQAYVLDRRLQPVPIGVVGAIYVGGVGLARGYQNRPGLTAEKFVPNPFSPVPGARLYCTGDLGRWSSFGELEYIGRSDHQVKVRGYRIELGEIEAALNQHENVRQCAVVTRTDSFGQKILAGYVASLRQPEPSSEDLREFLRQSLPEYMLPSLFVLLTALPLNSNGKVDRGALPDPPPEGPMGRRPGPLTVPEELLIQIWEDLLGVKGIGRHDNFFDLGGHSLLAFRVASRIRSGLAVQVPIRWLFQHPTIAELAQEVDNARGMNNRDRLVTPIQQAARDQDLPLSSGQQRLWFLDQFDPGNSLYNVPLVWRLRNSLDIRALRLALQETIRRHEILRTRFERRGEGPVQLIDPPGEILLPVLAVTGSSEKERAEIAREMAQAEVKRPFRLHEGVPLRTTLLELDQEEHWLVVTMHHIVTDGWSMDVFARELDHFYEAFSTGAHPALQDMQIQYADYAVWERELLQGTLLEGQLEYWRRQLEGIPAALELPTDRPRLPVMSHHGSLIAFYEPPALTAKLKDLSRREGVTLFMTLLAAFQVLLYRYTGQDDIAVGIPIAGRNRAETENLIGFFVNTLVLRTDLSGDPSFRELLASVRETALGAYAHQEMPFERLVEELKPDRDLGSTPLFQVMFLFQSTPAEAPSLSSLRMATERIATGNTKFELSLSILETGEKLSGAFTYSTDLFDSSRIERMVGHLRILLEGIVENPEQPVSELRLLTEAERQLMLTQWNQPQRIFSGEGG